MLKGERFSKLIRRSAYGLAAFLLMTFQLFVFVPTASAAADTCTWTGAVNGNWSNGGNWSGCDNSDVPQSGDSLSFPASASNKAMNNDLSITLASITVASGATGYTIDGNDVTLSVSFNILGSIQFQTAGLQFSGNNTSATLNVQDTGSFILPSTVNLSLTGTSNFEVYSTLPNFPLPVFTGTTNTFGLNNSSAFHTFVMSDNSTFTAPGGVFIQNSNLNCQADNCLGDSANPVEVGVGDETTGAQLQLWVDGLTLPYDITLDNHDLAAGKPSIEFDGATGGLSGDVTVNSDSLVSLGVATATASGNWTMNADVAFSGQGYDQSSLTRSGATTGSGDISVSDMAISFSADSASYTGTITAHSGTLLRSTTTDALGSTSAPTIIESGATYFTENFLTVDEPLTLSGNGISGSGYHGALVDNGTVRVQRGNITLNGNTTVENTGTPGVLSLRGIISGTGNLTLLGSTSDNAGIELGGSGLSSDDTSNSYSGTTYVNNTRAYLSKHDNVLAIPHDVVVTAIPARGAELRVLHDEELADDATITLDSDSSTALLLITGGHTETVGTVEGDGRIELASSTDRLRVGGGGKSGTFTGEVLSPGGPIVKLGTGTWDFQGKNVDEGTGFATYEVAEGKFLANFADTSGGFSTFGVTGGTLGGSSIIGSTIVYDGGISPGNSPGCLNPDDTLDLRAGSTLTIELAGSTPCSGYDRVSATGAVTITNATLNLIPSFTPAKGAVFTILSGASITGQFDGLTNGATITANGLKFRINYTATSVTLTYLGGTLLDSSSSAGAESTLANTGGDMYAIGLIALMLIGSGIGLSLPVVRRLQQTPKR